MEADAAAPAPAWFYATVNQGAALTKALHALAHLAAGTALAFDFDEAQGLTVTVNHMNMCVTLLRVPRTAFARWHGGGRRALSLCLSDTNVLKHMSVPKSVGKACALTFAARGARPDQLEVYFYAADVDVTDAAVRATHAGALARLWLTDDFAATTVWADFAPALTCELVTGTFADAVADLNGRDCTNAGVVAAAGAGGAGSSNVIALRGLVDSEATTANVELVMPAKNIHVVVDAAGPGVFAVVYLKLIADVLALDAKATVTLRVSARRLHAIAGCGAALPGATVHAHLSAVH